MKALCISGGGSKGAFAGGLIEYLVNKENKSWDLFVGTSTGSLITPLVSFGRIQELFDGYTNINQKDIFKVNPFKIKGKKTSINFLNVFYNMFIRGKESFGDATNLKLLIDRFVNEDDFNKLKETNKNVIITVTNSTLATVEYKSLQESSFSDFKEWMLASCTIPPFMEYVHKNGYQYSDGGMKNPIPIQEAINRGATEIDVVVLRKKESNLPIKVIKNPFDSIIRTSEIMLDEIGLNDLEIGKLISLEKDITLNIYNTPRSLTDNSLIFNKKDMLQWWVEGYQYGKTQNKTTYKILKK